MSQQIFCGILHIGEIYISSNFSCEKKIVLVQSSWVKVFFISFEVVEQLHYVFFCSCQCQILLLRLFSFFANEFFRSMSDYVFIAVCIKWNLMIIMISNQQPCIFGQCLFCNTVVSTYRKFRSTQVLGYAAITVQFIIYW